MIPRIAHFVFGLEEQPEPFHFLHYASVESCRRVLAPERIYFHHKHLPWGPWWERIRPHLTLVEVDHAEEVLAAGSVSEKVPAAYRYAHHADFIRLDVLIERGGVYADIDTIFVRPFPDDLFGAPFVLGREEAVRDEAGDPRPSLCNAVLMAEPGAAFARAWRGRMAGAMNGTWSNHSGFLSEELSRLMPASVHVEPEVSFFAFPPTRSGVSRLLNERHPVPEEALSVHLWAHLWWERHRQDFSVAHGGWCTPAFVARGQTTVADLLRSYLPDRTGSSSSAHITARPPASSARPGERWSYLSLDEHSGYGIAADRCMAALEESGLQVEWTPFIPGDGWRLGYEPGYPLEPVPGEVVVSHLVAEYLPPVRERCPDSFLVGHTVWDTDRLPDHWIPCLDAADLVVVPSRFSADAVATSAVDTPVAIVPHTAAPATGHRVEWPLAPPDVLVFYAIGEWNERKAMSKTIEAYLRAFTSRDRVLLIVKTSYQDWRRRRHALRPGVAGPGTSAAAVAQLLAKHADPPAVSLITRPLTNAQIAALHERGDCFISLSRCEGWGLGAFDAAAADNPVVTTGFGGQLDYLTDSPYLVGFDVVSVSDPRGFPTYAPEQRWAEPDLDHAVALLREVAAHPEPAAILGAAIGARIRHQYRPAAIATAFRKAVDQHHCLPSRSDRVRGTTRS